MDRYSHPAEYNPVESLAADKNRERQLDHVLDHVACCVPQAQSDHDYLIGVIDSFERSIRISRKAF